MRPHASLTRPLFLVALFASACGEGAPLEDQGLRDILAADPEELAALPVSAGRHIAERLEEARTQTAEEWRLAERPDQPPAALVLAADRGREEPPICATFKLSESAVLIATMSDPSGDETQHELPALEGVETEGARDAERRALAGKAGRLLRALSAASGAQRLVRIAGWPVGAAAIGDTVYVNSAWLVALSYLEEELVLTPQAGPVPARVASAAYALDDPTKGCSDSCEQSCKNSCNRCGQTACDDLGDGPAGVACKNYCHGQKVCSVAPPRRGAWRSQLRVALWLILPLLFMLRPQRRRR